MYNELPLDVLDRILTHIPDFRTLAAIFAVSKHTYTAFSARPRSIFKAVLKNRCPAMWPSVACLLHFKATGEIVEEAQAGDILLDRTAIAHYCAHNCDVIEFVERFEDRYTVRHELTDEQFDRVYRALYRLWLYQARFGADWSCWMRSLSAEEEARPSSFLRRSLSTPRPESLAAGRAHFLTGLPHDEVEELQVIFHFLRKEVVQWLGGGANRVIACNMTHEMEGVARELVAHELPDLLQTMLCERNLDPVYSRFADGTNDQFLLPCIDFYEDEFVHPEVVILGQDHMCFLPCGLCKRIGRALWYHGLDIAGYWGSAFEFAYAFLPPEAWEDEEDIYDPFVFIRALDSGTYTYNRLIDDVFRCEGITDGRKLLVCSRCMDTLLTRHVTSCWLEEMLTRGECRSD